MLPEYTFTRKDAGQAIAASSHSLLDSFLIGGQEHFYLEGQVSMALPDEIDLDMDIDTFRAVLSEVLRQELGISEVELGKRWQGGELIPVPENAAANRSSFSPSAS